MLVARFPQDDANRQPGDETCGLTGVQDVLENPNAKRRRDRPCKDVRVAFECTNELGVVSTL